MNAHTPDGGPAFPVTGCVHPNGNAIVGMTLRDYFAGQALAGMLTSGKAIEWKACEIADGCYSIADAMISAREGKPK